MFVVGTLISFISLASLLNGHPVLPRPTPIPTVLTSPSPSTNPSPTPSAKPIVKQPSPTKESLSVTAYLWGYLNDSQKTQEENKYGTKTDLQTITAWALTLDNDPAKLALDEAEVEKLQQAANRPASVPVYYPTTTSLHCSTYGIGQFASTSCY